MDVILFLLNCKVLYFRSHHSSIFYIHLLNNFENSTSHNLCPSGETNSHPKVRKLRCVWLFFQKSLRQPNSTLSCWREESALELWPNGGYRHQPAGFGMEHRRRAIDKIWHGSIFYFRTSSSSSSSRPPRLFVEFSNDDKWCPIPELRS